MSETLKIVGIGAGGHAKILVEIIQQTAEYELMGFTDADRNKVGTIFMGCPVLGGDEELIRLYSAGVRRAFLGVGAVSVEGTHLRSELFCNAIKLGFQMATLVHPRAVVSPSANIGAGSVIMGGAVVNAGTRIGDNVVVYSGAIIEHDSVIENHVHLSPGVMIAGDVKVEQGAFIGLGASIIQGVRIGEWATIGAGAVLLDDIPRGCTAVGVPARIVSSGTVKKRSFRPN